MNGACCVAYGCMHQTLRQAWPGGLCVEATQMNRGWDMLCCVWLYAPETVPGMARWAVSDGREPRAEVANEDSASRAACGNTANGHLFIRMILLGENECGSFVDAWEGVRDKNLTAWLIALRARTRTARHLTQH